MWDYRVLINVKNAGKDALWKFIYRGDTCDVVCFASVVRSKGSFDLTLYCDCMERAPKPRKFLWTNVLLS